MAASTFKNTSSTDVVITSVSMSSNAHLNFTGDGVSLGQDHTVDEWTLPFDSSVPELAKQWNMRKAIHETRVSPGETLQVATTMQLVDGAYTADAGHVIVAYENAGASYRAAGGGTFLLSRDACKE